MKTKVEVNGVEITLTPEQIQKVVEATKKRSAKQRFLELCEGLTVKTDPEQYPGSVFFFKDGEVYYEIKNRYLWVRRVYVWSIFESEFGMEYTEIQEMIKSVVEEHFKLKGLTPGRIGVCHPYEVEEHFKNMI